MKLYSVVLIAVFLYLISCVLRNAVFYTGKLEQSVQQEFKSYSAKKFISQSFKNTCEGRGFKSLDQWQIVCKELFKLDSIYYRFVLEDEKLIYAKWDGALNNEECSGEVYFRINNEGEL